MISCIIALKNRTARLEQMLPTWTKVSLIKDFVIVDWDSKEPIIENKILIEQMEKYNIKVIRVENQKYYHRCLALNLASQYTDSSNKVLLKLDVDYVNLSESWLRYQKIKDGELVNYFITGCASFCFGSMGFLLVNKKDFGKGYNENLMPIWGYEDEDLYNRLSTKKIEINNWWQEFKSLQRVIFFDIERYMYHISHDDYLRYVHCLNQNNMDYRRNIQISQEKPDWESRKYKTLDISGNYVRLELI